MNGQERRVIVGYDGSATADAALDWAATEARRRGVPLTVLHVVEQDTADETAERGVRRARAAAEGLQVRAETQVGHAAASLVRSSTPGTLVVVGTRGHGGVMASHLGSVAFAVVSHAEHPVVVVRGDKITSDDPLRPVVAGVDRWPHAEPIVEVAGEFAASSGAALVVVSAYQDEPAKVRMPRELWASELGGDTDLVWLGREAAEAAAEAATVHARARYPALDVRYLPEEGAPGRELLAWTRRAALLVVGDRGAGGFPALRLGSVTYAVLHRAACPVAVVRVTAPQAASGRSASAP